MKYRVAYVENPAVGFTVELLRKWERDEITEPVMSASSGPKDYTRNHVWAIFDRYPNVAQVLMVRGQYVDIGKDHHPSAPLLLVADAAGRVWDMAGKQVELKEQS